METLKILLISVVASIAYGEIHDQFTAHLCVEYFSVLHPHVVNTNSPAIFAMVWGVLATWWVGLFLGLFLAASARLGSEPRLTSRDMVKPILGLLAVMAVCASAAGVLGYVYPRSVVNWHDVIDIPESKYRNLNAVWFSHNASYASGIVGGLVLCVLNVLHRVRASKKKGTAEAVPV